jgi:hypothetical protein
MLSDLTVSVLFKAAIHSYDIYKKGSLPDGMQRTGGRFWIESVAGDGSSRGGWYGFSLVNLSSPESFAGQYASSEKTILLNIAYGSKIDYFVTLIHEAVHVVEESYGGAVTFIAAEEEASRQYDPAVTEMRRGKYEAEEYYGREVEFNAITLSFIHLLLYALRSEDLRDKSSIEYDVLEKMLQAIGLSEKEERAASLSPGWGWGRHFKAILAEWKNRREWASKKTFPIGGDMDEAISMLPHLFKRANYGKHQEFAIRFRWRLWYALTELIHWEPKR